MNHCNPGRPTDLATAIAYLESVGETLEPVTIKRHRARGWEFYARSAQQMLSSAEVIEFAASERDIRS